jgi:hypothetical protein
MAALSGRAGRPKNGKKRTGRGRCHLRGKPADAYSDFWRQRRRRICRRASSHRKALEVASSKERTAIRWRISNKRPLANPETIICGGPGAERLLGNTDRTTHEEGPDCYRLVSVAPPASRRLACGFEGDVDRAPPGPPALIEEDWNAEAVVSRVRPAGGPVGRSESPDADEEVIASSTA